MAKKDQLFAGRLVRRQGGGSPEGRRGRRNGKREGTEREKERRERRKERSEGEGEVFQSEEKIRSRLPHLPHLPHCKKGNKRGENILGQVRL